MPQTTLSRGLKLSPTAPPMKKPIKNAAKLSPAVLKAKQAGAQGRFPGKARTMDEDLRALGLDPGKFLGIRRSGVPDAQRTEVDRPRENKAFEAAAEVIALDDDGSEGTTNRLLRGSVRRGKDQNSAIAPTEQDVHPEEGDHLAAATAVQRESDAVVQRGEVACDAVRGSKGMKRRAPSAGEGGAAGAGGQVSDDQLKGQVPKKKKDAYEIRTSPQIKTVSSS